MLWRPKITRVPTLAISGLPLGSPRTKNHLDVGPVERCRVYYKGEGGGFPQVWAVVSLVCPCCLWLVLAPKVLQLHTNHLVWVLCRPVWMSEACQLFLVPSRSSSTPLYPSKCYELGSVPQFFCFPLFSTWTHIWVFQGVGSASHILIYFLLCFDVFQTLFNAFLMLFNVFWLLPNVFPIPLLSLSVLSMPSLSFDIVLVSPITQFFLLLPNTL